MDRHRLSQLLTAWRTGGLSASEERELLDAIAGDASGADTIPVLEDLLAGAPEGAAADTERWRPVLEAVLAVDKPEREVPVIGRRPTVMRRWGWVAAVLVFLVAGLWVLRSRMSAPVTVPAIVRTDIPAPTGTHATVTLGSGKTILLDSVDAGQLAVQGGARLVKTGGGGLVYQAGAGASGELVYNTVYNPRGSRVVSLVLSDGSQVWLNAASSIRYPAAFDGPDRRVQMTGEAYFEVAKNAAKPFSVTVRSREIDVLGTEFNVNAYADEAAMVTTLVNGSVREGDRALQPGQQAVAEDQQEVVISKGDIPVATAWKNGAFAFSNVDVPGLMRQLSRWYDIDVQYAGAVPAKRFSGEIGRSLSLAQVLRILTKSDIHYKITNDHTLVIQ